MSEQKTVFVGLSGGVDSSVAAARLLARGCRVVGVFIKVWHPDFLVCNWEEERVDAMRVAAHLGIPFLTCDGEAAYRDAVAAYFIESYRAGLTPNPDVMCNKEVKFGVFRDFALANGADYVATGHYARVMLEATSGLPGLYRGVDSDKDQSYFLYTLSNEQLATTLFPIGDTTKDALRHEAARLMLPTATKKDSQGVCFLGHIDIPDFLRHYIDLSPGAVLDEQGTRVGTHQGAFVYTIGQRHGFTIETKEAARAAQYIVAKDIEANTITVSSTPPRIESGTILTLQHTITRSPLVVGETYLAQTRYRQTPFVARVVRVTTAEIDLQIEVSTELPSRGQSCVLYRDDLCLGGGIIGACQ